MKSTWSTGSRWLILKNGGDGETHRELKFTAAR
jgi:hypothetical protein